MENKAEWTLIYRQGAHDYFCFLDDGDAQVRAVSSDRDYDRILRKNRNGTPSITTSLQAKQRLERLWAAAGFAYPHTLKNFLFQPEGPRRSGLVTGFYAVSQKGYTFLGNHVGIAFAIDVYDGGLLGYTWRLRSIAVGDPHAKLTAAQAFTHVHFVPPYDKLVSWHTELGWYVPTGKTVARLGWRFWRPRDEAHAWIVDANDGRVQKPQY